MKENRISIFFIIAIWGIIASLSFVKPMTIEDWIYLLIGFAGIIYVTIFSWVLFGKPIKRDLIIAKGNYLWKSLLLVLVIPVSLTFIMKGINRQCDQTIFTAEKMVSDTDTLYRYNDQNYIQSSHDNPTLFWTIYYHFVDPGNQHMAVTSTTGRISAAVIAILGIFLLNGFLVSIIIGWVDRRKEQWQNGRIRYKLQHLGRNRFAIVIGANEIAASVIKNLLTTRKEGDINFKSEGDNNYVILHTNRDVQSVRETLSSHLSEEMLDKVIIYNGLRNSKKELENLYLAYCTEIYVLGESELQDGGENYHDAMNMQCVNLIAEVLDTTRKQIPNNKVIKKKVCKVMFDYQTTHSIFQFSDIPSTVKTNLVFIPFSRYESWARKVIVDGYSLLEDKDVSIDYIPLDGQGLGKDSDEHVHFVIVGMSKMGIAMGIQAILQCHYLNYQKARTRITFIDTNADKEKDFFSGRYYNLFELTRHRYIDASECPKDLLNSSYKWEDPMEKTGCKWKHLSHNEKNFIDIELEFIKGEIESESIREYLQQISADNKSKLTIAICLTQTHQAVAAALYLPIEVYKNTKLQQIWVYQRESADIIMNLYDTDQMDLRYKKLRPFGMLYGEYMADRKVYLKALLANGAYEWKGKKKTENEIDMAVKSTYSHLSNEWKKLTIEKKWSNKYFVDSIYIKIRGILKDQIEIPNTKCGLENLLKKVDLQKYLDEELKTNEEILAECEHNRWLLQQLMMGFNPCEAAQDKELCRLNKELCAQKGEDTYKQKYKKHKEKIKNSPDRNHPNICSYTHLDDVDYQAKDYDKFLNNAIPAILILVDGHGIIKLDQE